MLELETTALSMINHGFPTMYHRRLTLALRKKMTYSSWQKQFQCVNNNRRFAFHWNFYPKMKN
jgi:hypothetical protein